MFDFKTENFEVKLSEQIELLRLRFVNAKEKIVTETAREMKEEVTKNVPFKSGVLKDSIDSSCVSGDLKTTVFVGDLHGNAPYGKFVEYGGANNQPKPFLIPALGKYSKILLDKFSGFFRGIK